MFSAITNGPETLMIFPSCKIAHPPNFLLMVFLSTPRRSAARHCEIRPPAYENLLSSDFLSGR